MFTTPLLWAQNASSKFISYPIQSSVWGNEYSFALDLFDFPCDDPVRVSVYIELIFPDKQRKIYQLDYLRHRIRRSYFSYSCILVLKDVGEYRCSYFVIYSDASMYGDSHDYHFVVKDDLGATAGCD
ncbi:MAG: hypothetical protein GXP45_08385 [bacterium]|nr:hypothetical protein [bacterium]